MGVVLDLHLHLGYSVSDNCCACSYVCVCDVYYGEEGRKGEMLSYSPTQSLQGGKETACTSQQ